MSVIAITALLLILFNILICFILLHRFKTLFSTRQIVDETRSAINEKIREANNATERNMSLIDEKIQELNKVKAEADRRLAVLRRELDTQQRESEFRAAMAATGKTSRKNASPYGAHKATPVQAELAFTDKARMEFGIAGNVVPMVKAESSSHEVITQKQETLQEIPIVNPVVYRSEDQIVPKKDFFQQVREYHMAGLPAEEIARLTSRSAQEVRLVLQML